MKKRVTYHEGQSVDISDDTRPTAWDTGIDLPFRPVKDQYSELLVYVYRQLSIVRVSSSLSNPHINFAYLLMSLLDVYFKAHGISPYLNAKGE